MAKQTINLGTAPNDQTGTTIRVGGQMINDNFDELYTKGGLIGDPFFIVAASNSPTTLKNRADYICDGVSDEVEIEAALALGNVQLVQGIYNIYTTIDVPTDRTLQGVGKSSVIFTDQMTSGFEPTPSTTNVMITNTGGKNIILKDFKLEGSVKIGQSDPTAYGMWFESVGSGEYTTAVQGLIIENVYFEKFRSTGIKFRNCHNSIINKCEFLNVNQDAITLTRILTGDLRTSNVTISNNIISGGLAGIFISYADDIIVEGNNLIGQAEYNMQFDYPRRVLVNGNRMINALTFSAIKIGGAGGGASNHNIVTNNYISGAGGIGIEFLDSPYGVISNNSVSQCGYEGIWVQGPSIVVSGNVVSSNSKDTNNNSSGIIVWYCDNTIITGNIVKKGVNANKQKYGITLYGSASEKTFIHGNDLEDSGNLGDFERGSTAAIISKRNNIALDGTWMGDNFVYSNNLTPAQIVANTNNYNPTGLNDAAILRLSTDASRNITGLAGVTNGRMFIIDNVGSFDIVFTQEDALSTATNRFLFGITLTPNGSITIRYDGVSGRWRLVSKNI